MEVVIIGPNATPVNLAESSLEMSRKIRIDPKTEIPVPDFKGTLSEVPHAVDFLLKNGRRP